MQTGGGGVRGWTQSTLGPALEPPLGLQIYSHRLPLPNSRRTSSDAGKAGSVNIISVLLVVNELLELLSDI